MTSDSPVIHVVDDDASFRTAIARLLQTSGYRVALYRSGNEFLDNPPGPGPGCILLDMRMTGVNGLELQDRLSQRGYILPIVFLTGHGNIPTTVQAIKGGAEDFLSKPVSKKNLLPAIHRALVQYEKRRAEQDSLLALRARLSTLTNRENEVFALVVRGKLNKQIAHELGTSERTIKLHRHNLMEKLGVRSVAELVSLAARSGLSPAADGNATDG
jgi:FixJ family two-component response regulator